MSTIYTCAEQISSKDRAIQFGDGFFTTLAVSEGKVEFWPSHLERLKVSAKRLFIPFEDWSGLQQVVFELAKEQKSAVVKILISRGEGGRGYSTELVSTPNAYVSLHPRPTLYNSWQQQGIDVGVSDMQLGRNPALAGIKHLNRLEQILIKQHLGSTNYDDVIVCDSEGLVVEGSASNIFWLSDNTWYTPSLTHSGVAGVMRSQVIQAMQKRNLEIKEVSVRPDELREIRSLLLCNSLMGVVPVKRFSLLGHTRELDLTPVFELQSWFGGEKHV